MYVLVLYSKFDTRYKFTAKELDNETSYTYFGARYYDSELSGWLSVDPMSDKYPSLSPYCYTADNPVVLVDPNGEKVYIVGDAADEATGNLIKKPYKFSQPPYNKPSSIHDQIINNK
jgi:RHS repeat-associated protein